LKARFSTLFKKSDSSRSEAKRCKPRKYKKDKRRVARTAVFSADTGGLWHLHPQDLCGMHQKSSVGCDNVVCIQKANGFWFGAAFNALIAKILSSDATSQEFCEGAPKVFR
jgi:hypothetical protein